MATTTLDQAGSANASMKLQLSYTNGNGNITITGLAGGRDSYGPTSDQNGGNRIYINIGGTTYTVTPSNNTITFGKSYNYVTFWSGSQSKSCEGNQTVTITFYSANGTGNINNSRFTTTINAGYSNPSLTINGAGSSSNPVIMSVPSSSSTAGCTINVSLGNTGGRQCTLKVNGATYDTISSDNNNYNIVLKDANSNNAHKVTNIVQSHTSSSVFTIPIELYIGSLTSGVKDVSVQLNENIKPSCTLTLSGSVGIEDTNGNAMTALNGIHVAGLTKPTFTFTTTGIYGSTVNTNKTLSITSGTSSAAMTVTTSPVTWGSAFNGVQTRTATLTCTDSRGRPGTSSGVSITLQDYDAPTVTPTITRCTSNGTTSATGHYAKISFSITKSPLIKNSSDINTFTLKYSIDNKATWTNVTVSGSNGTYTASTGAFGGGNFAEENAYTLYYMYEDIYKKGQVVPIVLDPAATLISRHTGGDGITLGRVATSSGFHNYLSSEFHDATTFTGSVQCNGNAGFAGTLYSTGEYISGLKVIGRNRVAIPKSGDAGKGLTNMDGTSIIRDHNNQNVTVDATGGTLFLGYQNTQALNFLSGKANMDSNGRLTSLIDYMWLKRNTRYNETPGSWHRTKIYYDSIMAQNGNLTHYNNGIKIGKNISVVFVMASMNFGGSDSGEIDLIINRNSDAFTWNTGTSHGLMNTKAFAIIPVSEGDVIYALYSYGQSSQCTIYEDSALMVIRLK